MSSTKNLRWEFWRPLSYLGVDIYLADAYSLATIIAFSLEIGIRPALYIKQQPKKEHGRTIQDGEVALLQS